MLTTTKKKTKTKNRGTFPAAVLTVPLSSPCDVWPRHSAPGHDARNWATWLRALHDLQHLLGSPINWPPSPVLYLGPLNGHFGWTALRVLTQKTVLAPCLCLLYLYLKVPSCNLPCFSLACFLSSRFHFSICQFQSCLRATVLMFSLICVLRIIVLSCLYSSLPGVLCGWFLEVLVFHFVNIL